MEKILIEFLTVFVSICTGKVSDGQYGKVPAVFHTDNYDQCMLRGNEALFCSFTYELKPLNSASTTEIWQTIEKLSSYQENYRHDRLRHAICVPETCPNRNLTGEISKEINQCYDDKFRQKHLKGIITEIKCETNKSSHPIDWFDAVIGVFFVAYISLVIYATSCDIWWKDLKEKQDTFSTKSRIISALSISKNWRRLLAIRNDENNYQWRAIQGVRFYNLLIIILCHTVLSAMISPVANTKYMEQISDKFLILILISGPLVLATNFFLAAFLLTYGLYSTLEGKTFEITTAFKIFFHRIMRLLPGYAVLILLLMTWVRHFGNGPYWNFVLNEFKYCRKNGWTNLLFLNTIINPEEMCCPHTWYLAQDTQFFLIALVLIWIFKKYHKLMFPTVTGIIVFCMSNVFLDFYLPDRDSSIFIYPELTYKTQIVRGNEQYLVHHLNFYGNLIPSLLGIIIGYNYYLNQKSNFLHKYDNLISKYLIIFTYGLGLTISLLPGILALQFRMEHSAFWASFYNAIARLIFTISMGGCIILCTLGYGGLTKKVLEWSPTFILGRLSYSTYLVHFIILVIRSALSRFPVYLSDYQIVTLYLGDVAMSYLAALVLALLIEFPINELQKLILPKVDRS